jgi:hypothetical protein
MSESATYEILPPEVSVEAQAAAETALAIEQHTTALAITSEPEYIAAAETVKELKARARAIEEKRIELTAPLNQSLKRINELFKVPHATILAAVDRIGRAMIGYQDVQRRARMEAERVAREAAQKEQRRLDALAMERASRAEKKGDLAKAEAILEAVPVVVPPPVVAVPDPPAVKGLTTKSYWRHEVTDFAALVTACAAGEVPLEALLPNDKLLGQTARALKTAMRWPGVRVIEEKQLAGTGR